MRREPQRTENDRHVKQHWRKRRRGKMTQRMQHAHCQGGPADAEEIEKHDSAQGYREVQLGPAKPWSKQVDKRCGPDDAGDGQHQQDSEPDPD